MGKTVRNMGWNKKGLEAKRWGKPEAHDGGSQQKDMAEPTDDRVSRRRGKGRVEQVGERPGLRWPCCGQVRLFLSWPVFLSVSPSFQTFSFRTQRKTKIICIAIWASRAWRSEPPQAYLCFPRLPRGWQDEWPRPVAHWAGQFKFGPKDSCPGDASMVRVIPQCRARSLALLRLFSFCLACQAP